MKDSKRQNLVVIKVERSWASHVMKRCLNSIDSAAKERRSDEIHFFDFS